MLPPPPAKRVCQYVPIRVILYSALEIHYQPAVNGPFPQTATQSDVQCVDIVCLQPRQACLKWTVHRFNSLGIAHAWPSELGASQTKESSLFRHSLNSFSSALSKMKFQGHKYTEENDRLKNLLGVSHAPGGC